MHSGLGSFLHGLVSYIYSFFIAAYANFVVV